MILMIVIALLVIIGFNVTYGSTSNVTLTMDDGDFTYCYKGMKKGDVSCNNMQLDQDRFKLMSDFLRFLDSGMVKRK